ncbi:MAG: hypothetical protein ACRCSK_07230 [Fusobacteriaceae bacterium]
MVDFISLIFIFGEASLTGKFISLVITMPYLVYLTNFRNIKSYILMSIIVIIYTLQNGRIFFVGSIIVLFCFVNFIILHQLKYSVENVLILVPIQFVFLLIALFNNLSVNMIIFNLAGLILVNYLYIMSAKKKEQKDKREKRDK